MKTRGRQPRALHATLAFGHWWEQIANVFEWLHAKPHAKNACKKVPVSRFTRHFVTHRYRVPGHMDTTLTEYTVVKHGDEEFCVPTEMMRTLSPVFASFLEESMKPHVITIDDLPVDHVRAFLKLSMTMCHDQKAFGGPCTPQEIIRLIPLAMPMVHKYEASGVLNFVQAIVNMNPTPDCVVSVLKYGSDSLDWMDEKVKDYTRCRSSFLSSKNILCAGKRTTIRVTTAQ